MKKTIPAICLFFSFIFVFGSERIHVDDMDGWGPVLGRRDRWSPESKISAEAEVIRSFMVRQKKVSADFLRSVFQEKIRNKKRSDLPWDSFQGSLRAELIDQSASLDWRGFYLLAEILDWYLEQGVNPLSDDLEYFHVCQTGVKFLCEKQTPHLLYWYGRWGKDDTVPDKIRVDLYSAYLETLTKISTDDPFQDKWVDTVLAHRLYSNQISTAGPDLMDEDSLDRVYDPAIVRALVELSDQYDTDLLTKKWAALKSKASDGPADLRIMVRIETAVRKLDGLGEFSFRSGKVPQGTDYMQFMVEELQRSEEEAIEYRRKMGVPLQDWTENQSEPHSSPEDGARFDIFSQEGETWPGNVNLEQLIFLQQDLTDTDESHVLYFLHDRFFEFTRRASDPSVRSELQMVVLKETANYGEEGCELMAKLLGFFLEQEAARFVADPVWQELLESVCNKGYEKLLYWYGFWAVDVAIPWQIRENMYEGYLKARSSRNGLLASEFAAELVASLNSWGGEFDLDAWTFQESDHRTVEKLPWAIRDSARIQCLVDLGIWVPVYKRWLEINTTKNLKPEEIKQQHGMEYVLRKMFSRTGNLSACPVPDSGFLEKQKQMWKANRETESPE